MKKQALTKSSSETTGSFFKDALDQLGLEKFDVLEGWEPREGCCYSVTRAISARINQNFDGWPSSELKKSYRTFLGRPVFVNHVNDDPRKARGRVVAARYVEDGDDRYIEVIQEVNATKFPMLAHELASGGLDSVSMGCDAGISVCSYCGNVAHSQYEMCDHVLNHKGHTLQRRNRDGSIEDVLVYEKCGDINFFELSYVFDPADETALVSNVVTASTKKGYGETMSPPHVDTLRSEEEDLERFFIDPPDQFKDPELTRDLLSNDLEGTNLEETPLNRRRSRLKSSGSASWQDHGAEHYLVEPGDDREGATVFDNGDGTFDWELQKGSGGTADSLDQAKKDAETAWESRKSSKRISSGQHRMEMEWQQTIPITYDELLDFPQLSSSERSTASETWILGDLSKDEPIGYAFTVNGKSYWGITDDMGMWVDSGVSNSIQEARRAAGDIMRGQPRTSRTKETNMKRRADKSRNDQGVAEETFVSGTPDPEPVDLGDGNVPVTDNNDEAMKDRGVLDHLEARRRRALRELAYVRRTRKRLAEQSDDYDLLSASDIDSQVEDEDVPLDENMPETQPKDASVIRRARVNRNKRLARIRRRSRRKTSGWGKMPQGQGGFLGDAYIFEGPNGSGTYFQNESEGGYDANFGLPGNDMFDDDYEYFDSEDEARAWIEEKGGGHTAYKRRSSRRRKVAENFEVGDKVQWVMPDGTVEPGVGEITNVGSEGGQEFYELQWDTGETDEGTSRNLKHYEGSRKRSRRRAGLNWELDESDGVTWAVAPNGQEMHIEPQKDGTFLVGPDDGLGFTDYEEAETLEEAKALGDAWHNKASKKARRRRADVYTHPDVGELHVTFNDNDGTAVVTSPEVGEIGVLRIMPDDSPEDIEEQINILVDEARTASKKARRRRADANAEVASPGGRVDVEKPVLNTTDDEAQSSQYDRGAFGDNAGDDVANPDLSTDHNWAPGEGEKVTSSRASQIESLKLAEAMAEAGLESYEDRWKLAEAYTKLSSVIVRDRIALLERIATVRKSSPERKARRTSRVARSSTPRGLGSAPTLRKSSGDDRSDDYSIFF